MSFKVVIPARYASTRLPGKPLLDIAGKPMIQRVFEAAGKSDASQIVVATDNEAIAEACEAFGAEVCMTSAEHPSGTDRLEEVVRKLNFADDEIVVNVQGDEPLIPASLINQVALNLVENSWASISTLCEPINDSETLFDPNAVKVVFNKEGQALYFSRSAIPWNREKFSLSKEEAPTNDDKTEFKLESQLKSISENYYRHIGIYAYRCHFLREYVTWPPSSLELMESLEQLRVIDNGNRIHVEEGCEASAAGIDTAEDLEKIRKLFS